MGFIKLIAFAFINFYVFSIQTQAQFKYSISTIAGLTPEGQDAKLVNMHPVAMEMDDDGNIYLADYAFNQIRKIDIQTGTITTIAGTNLPTFEYNLVEGSLAKNARLSAPYRMAIHSNRILYFIEGYHIRKIDLTTNVITTVAGKDRWEFSGDGGPAIQAGFQSLRDIIVDQQGNIFIADENRIRKIDAQTQVIRTIAGDDLWEFSGDGGPATQARFQGIRALSVDQRDNLFVSTHRNRIRKIDATTDFINTIDYKKKAGESNINLSGPNRIVIDKIGDLYIADLFQVRKIDVATGIISDITQILPSSILGLEMDSSGNLYALDYNKQIKKIAVGSRRISVLAGTSEDEPYTLKGFSGENKAATQAQLNTPWGITTDNEGNIYIADTQNHRIRKIDQQTGTITTIAGNGGQGYSGDGGSAISAELNSPSDVAIDRFGNVFIADIGNNRVRVINHKTGKISTIAGNGSKGYSGDGGQATEAELTPSNLAFDPYGNIYVVDKSHYVIRRVDLLKGTISTVAGNGIYGQSTEVSSPSSTLGLLRGIAIDPQFNIYFIDSDRIRKLDAKTQMITTVPGGEKTYGYSLDIDLLNNLYITTNSNVEMIHSTLGTKKTIAGIGRLGYSSDGGDPAKASFNIPRGIAVDRQGTVYIADTENHLVRKLTPESTPALPQELDGVKIVAYPNPTTDIVKIKIEGEINNQSAQLSIFDAQGQKMKTVIKKLNNGILVVPIRHLPNGQYLFKIQLSKRKIILRRIMKI